MSQTYIAVIVMVLGGVLPKIGVTLGNEELTTVVSSLALIGGAVWALIRRYRQGDVTLAGVRK
jgi:hypothetical protein